MPNKPVEKFEAHEFTVHNEQVFHFKNTYMLNALLTAST
jgi:hypothetical protein